MVHLDLVNSHRDKNKQRSYYQHKVEKEIVSTIHRTSALIVSLLAPLVVLLGLPGLTEYWYVKLSADGTIDHARKDPVILTVALSISFVFAVLGTFFLLFRLIDKNPRFCSFLSIGSFIVHIVISIISLSLFAVRAARPEQFVLSTAFWLTATSAIFAFAVVTLLLLDGMVTSFTFSPAGVNPKQRSMILGFMIFIVIVVIGTISFKYLIALSFLDAIYFVIQTVITTGFGDIVPTTTGGQVFAILYNTFGILSFAIVVVFIRNTALDSMETTYKERERVILTRVKTDGFRRTLTGFFGMSVGTDDSHSEHSEKGAMDKDYEEAVMELKEERRREFRGQVFVSTVLFITIWIIGSAVFMKLEGWTFFISFYFCFISFSSVGYGDYAPKTPPGRAFFCIWSLIGAGSLTVLFSVLSEAYSDRFKETFQHRWFARVASRIPFIPTSFSHKEIEKVELEIHKPKDDKDQIKLDIGKTLSVAASSSSSPPNYSTPEDDEKSPQKEKGKGRSADKLGEVLLDLISDVKEHVSQLIHSDGVAGSTPAIEQVVKKVMEEENFSVRNRELVNSDDDLKRFIYLRRLDEKLTKLQETAKKAIEEADEDGTRGGSANENHRAWRDAIDQVDADRDEIDEESQ